MCFRQAIEEVFDITSKHSAIQEGSLVQEQRNGAITSEDEPDQGGGPSNLQNASSSTAMMSPNV